ncbi:hypothetical protein I4U23_030524 [Adineta vaga]|nr:hypothetical protein I4U23_030524 [Adineta vaga]
MSTSLPPSTSSRPNDFFDLPEEARADDQYVVEKILAKRRNRKGKWEYLLKWAGFGDADNTWESQNDIHPDLIAEFERQQVEADASNPIYSVIGEDQPQPQLQKSRVSVSAPTSSLIQTESPPPKKKKKTSNSVILTSANTKSPASSFSSSTIAAAAATDEVRKKVFGVEKGWRVRAVIGAAKQKDSSVLYAVDYVQGSPVLREYVPSEVAHIYIPRELIEFFQKKIVWNTPK